MNGCVLAGIYGGFLLGVRSVNGLAFYDWDNTELIRRIEIQPKHVSQLLQSSCLLFCMVWSFLSVLGPIASVLTDFLVRLWWAGLHCHRGVFLHPALSVREGGRITRVKWGGYWRWNRRCFWGQCTSVLKTQSCLIAWKGLFQRKHIWIKSVIEKNWNKML